MKKISILGVVALLLVGIFSVDAAQAQQISQAQGGYGGPPNDRVTVCRETNSRFFPYVKVTVPELVVDRWIADGRAVLPDASGNCPKPEETIQDFIKDRIAKILDRIRG